MIFKYEIPNFKSHKNLLVNFNKDFSNKVNAKKYIIIIIGFRFMSLVIHIVHIAIQIVCLPILFF